jgi:RNA polymerase sigma-70 factor (ECF subfamily)
MVSTDGELYAAWQGGDNRAGGKLVDRHFSAIGRFFTNKVTNAADAEDLIAETFERCAKALGKFRG